LNIGGILPNMILILNNRYPEYKERLSISLTKKEARDILKKTKEVFKWLLTLKP
jgi:hypothetical protein